MPSSPYRGVSWHKTSLRWEAHVWMRSWEPQTTQRRGRQLYIGHYADEVTAAHAYDLATMKLRPGDASPNFPESLYSRFCNTMAECSEAQWLTFLRKHFESLNQAQQTVYDSLLWSPPIPAEAPVIFR